ncbi:MAG: glycoside hydrolase family 95 protein [Clostridia bacterium]|nr:glycoside hydrolase family 95 protein [Clostridia bacterium]
MKKYEIYNTTAPQKWTESIPIGCGRMGATLMCGVAQETMYLNEETVWSERKNTVSACEMREKIQKIRDLFLADKPAAANQLANQILNNNFPRIGSYESAGKLQIELHEGDSASNYERKLDLVNGIARVTYRKGGSRFEREYFASYPDNVIACRITSSKAPLSVSISYERDLTLSCHAENGVLTATAKTLLGDHEFCIKAKVVCDGRVTCEDGQILVSDTNSLCVYIVMGTQFRLGNEYVCATEFPASLDYEVLKARHVADFSALMSRANIELPSLEVLEGLPLQEYVNLRTLSKLTDESMHVLQWQYGRYLLVSSSRVGTLPANLQGLWTNALASGWSADYHTNINVQMNYWPAETVNLSDCHMPLFDYMNDYLLESGKKTARDYYNARGCVVHHLSDIYGFTAPADGPWGLWPHGASWLALHMWEHYLFTKDTAFLKNTAFPFIKEAAIFFLDTLAYDVKGRLVYAPSTSPENSYYVEEDGKRTSCRLASSATMDVQIISVLLQMYLESARILDIKDEENITAACQALENLPKMQIGKHGQLMEWIEDYEECNVGHRHISHAFGFHPAALITRKDKALYKALEITLKRRLSDVDSTFKTDIGWTLNWIAILFARLRNPSRALGMLDRFIAKSIRDQLLEIVKVPSMGGDIFQIDGNFGFVAAMSEMLIQSHEDVIAILPALPSRWHSGSFRGLCARGGYEIDAQWKECEITSIDIRAKFAGECKIELPPSQKAITFVDENGTVYTAVDHIISLNITNAIHLTAIK